VPNYGRKDSGLDLQDRVILVENEFFLGIEFFSVEQPSFAMGVNEFQFSVSSIGFCLAFLPIFF
jgi:hypothetical protein